MVLCDALGYNSIYFALSGVGGLVVMHFSMYYKCEIPNKFSGANTHICAINSAISEKKGKLRMITSKKKTNLDLS